MGRACGEGLAAADGHGLPKDGGQDAKVGDNDKQEGAEAHRDTGSMDCHFAGAGVAVGSPQQQGDITEDVLELGSPAEREPGGQEGGHGAVQQPPEPAACSDGRTGSMAHGLCVAQGLAHGCVAVIGHDSQECALGPCTPHQEERLCWALTVGDVCLLVQGICQHLGHHH